MGSSREAHRELSEREIVGSSSQLRVLDQVVTEIYLNANFAIRPFVWQIEVD